MATALVIPDKIKHELSIFRRKLHTADTAEKVLQIEVGVDALENAMRKSGLGEIEAIRPVRETFLDSRWTLGKILSKTPRGKPPGKKRTNGNGLEDTFPKETYLPGGLDRKMAMQAQRIAALPVKEKADAYEQAKADKILPTVSLLLRVGKPWWSKLNRQAKHKNIRSAARKVEEVLGPFPLIYADPPWKWGHFGEQDKENEKGKGRTPDQHYETLTALEIENFCIQGKPICEIAHEDAALFLWCTSSNIPLALRVMDIWGFEFKSSATWVKTNKQGKIWRGMGLVFRNAHEILLYGTRGRMPGPQYQPASAWLLPRLKHSEKPAEVRKEIEKMYPDFDEKSRLELFARSQNKGWTGYGFEA